MTDLETAARERALAMHLASIVGMYFPREVETHFNSGFLAGAAFNQKRIEELEDTIERNNWTMKSQDEFLTKERQISKMLEEGLVRAIRWTEVDVKEKTVTVEQWDDLAVVKETLAEVQKLRGDSKP